MATDPLRPRVAAVLVATVAAAAVAGATGCGGDSDGAAAKPQAFHRFRSRPDLRPARLVVKQARREVASGDQVAPGYLFIAAKLRGKPGGPLILDRDGQVVWFHPVQPREAADFRVQRYRGRPVLTWWEGTQPTIGIGAGRFLIVDASYRRVAELRAGNGLVGDLHEFLLTPRGTALILAYQKVPQDLRPLRGRKQGYVWDCVVQELDVATGKVRFQWRSLDHVPVAESAQRIPARRASKKQPFDYFHANSIDVDTDGNLLVSARNTHAVYKISRRDGRVLWRLGGRNSDFELGEGARFAWQHDARRQPDGTILLFDNSAIPKVADHSRALALRLDMGAMTASLAREYVHPRKLLAPHQGNVQQLPNGNVLVGWGGKPYVTEFSEDGRVLFDARLAAGDTYRAYRLPWSGRPADRPAVAVRRRADGMTVYASWNGATDLAGWEVLAGDAPGKLTRVVSVVKEGFETAIRVESEGRYVAVRALDDSSRVLGTSRVVRASDGP